METLKIALLFAVVIAVIYLAGRWRTSDADIWLGFGRPKPKDVENADPVDGDKKE